MRAHGIGLVVIDLIFQYLHFHTPHRILFHFVVKLTGSIAV